ncbi:MAG: tetratricopeptide repeat protein [Deltaproteobacteria bacterium]|nr:tetratricopeptide repeat protein [Deltaproteobacteria bacterium]
MSSPQREVEPVSDDEKIADGGTNGSSGAQLPDEAFVEGFQRTAPVTRESFGKASIQIIIATGLFMGALYFYWNHVQVQEQVRDLASQAKDAMMRDNPADLAKAQTLLDEALGLDSGHKYVVATKALINARLYQEYGIESAKAVANDFSGQAEKKDVQKQERYGAKGILMVAEGKYAEAETYLVDIVNQGGRGASIFEGLGLAQRYQGKLGDARKSLRAAAESEWRNPRYNAYTAEIYLQDNELTNAKSFVKKTLDANPNHILGLLLESRVNIARDDDVKKAKDNLDDVLARPEGELNPYLLAYAKATLAEFHIYNREYQKAVTAAEEALAAAPKLPVAHFAKGVALANMGNATALPALQTAYENYPYAPRAYHLAALALLEQNRAEEALQIMELWGKNVAKSANYHVAYGNILLKKGDEHIEEATKHFQDAIKADPEAREAYLRIGMIHQKAARGMKDEEERKKEYDKAIDAYNTAVGIKEQYAEVYEAMGWLYSEQGHFNEALPLFAKALTFFKNDRVERDKLNKIREDVGEALKKDKKFKRYYQPWMDESKALIR